MEKRGQFTFYRSYYEAVRKLSDRMAQRVLMAIIGYGLDGVEPEGLGGVEEAIFTLVKPTLDSGRKKAAAGKKGGEVCYEKVPALLSKQNKQSVSKKEIESEKEMEKEIEIENENEMEPTLEGPAEDGCGWEKQFDDFWAAYPVKVDKRRTQGVYRGIRQEHESIMKGLKLWKTSLQWQREGGRFIPRPAKFLRERHFEAQPVQGVLYGATGELGQAEVEAIERMMKEG